MDLITRMFVYRRGKQTVRVIRKSASFLAIAILVAGTAAAQYWPKPAATPGVDVTCTGCIELHNGKLTPGYPATITTFTGRFLDSQATQDYQQPFKTARAESVTVVPSLHRIYMQIGSAVFAYNLDTFFTRLASGEALTPVTAIPTTSGYYPRTPPAETFLNYDSFFYAENEPANGWTILVGDGQRRLNGFDVDDLGYVYMAYTYFSWGIAKDDLSSNHNLMQSLHQEYPTTGDEVNAANNISVLKSGGRYYALVGGGDSLSNVFDVTDRANPVKLPSIRKLIAIHAKSTAMDRIAFTGDGTLQIYDAAALVAGGSPLLQFRGANGGSVFGISSDGTNFYATSDSPSGLVISKFTPSGGSYTRDDYRFNGTGGTQHLSYGDGYLVWTGSINGLLGLRAFKLQNGVPVEIDFQNYFQRYYINNSDQRYTTPNFHALYDSTVVKKNNHTYLMTFAYSLGDVYELPSTDSVVVNNNGIVGTPNANVPAGSGTGPFYGDPVQFTATTPATAPMNINWDFGDGATASGLTGTPITHQFAGTTSGTSLTRTVKATNATDSSINSSVGVTVQKPTPRFGINSKFLFVQPNASSPAPIVVGDTFLDASDGLVESHYNTWVVDGVSTNLVPPAGPVGGVGVCGQHTLSFTANYGPYSAPGTPTGTPVALGITPFTYAVRPFAAAIDVTSDANNNVIFKNVSRVSASQSTPLNYRWELLDGSNQLINPPAPLTGQSPVDFTVSKSILATKPNVRAHLVITSSGALPTGCSPGFATAEAFTQPLNAPDPVISGSCPNGGPSCTFTAGSLRTGFDTVADGWTYNWSVTGGTPSSGTSSTFSPSFTQTGTYQVNLTATNSIGSNSAVPKSAIITVIPPSCPQMSAQNVFVQYSNPSFTCSQSPTSPACGVNELLTFTAQRYNYDFGCATHTFAWSFGDGSAATQPSANAQTVTHAYSSSGNYTVQLTIANPGQTFTVSQTVPVGGPPPPPPPPPPPTPTGCGTMVADQNVFIAYHDANFNCTASGGNCPANQPVYFAATDYPPYSFSCGTHIFNWNFGDGQTASNTQSPAHTYANSGTYPVTCSVSGPSGSVTLSASVKVGAGGPPPPPPPGPTPPTPPPSGSCNPVISGTTFFVDYAGPQTGCTEYGGDCNTSETLPFTVKTYNYDFGCATHTFQWDFGDSSTPGTGVSSSHRYIAAGAYALKVTISVNGQAYLVSQTVKVSGSGNPTQPPPGSTYPYDFTSQAMPGVPNGYIFNAFAAGSTSTADVTFNWDFGDHQTCNSCGAQVPHIYADSKNYTVTLSVNGVAGSVQHPAQSTSRRRGVHH